MDLGIKELGITLIVGVFTLLGAEVIAHFLFKRPLTTFFHDLFRSNKTAAADTPDAPVTMGEKDGKEATVTVAVFVGLVFAVGMVVEAISFKYVDDHSLLPKKLPAMVMGQELTRTIGMPPKDDDRVAVLIGSLDNPYPSPLAIDLAHSDAFLISDSARTGLRVQDWIKNPNRGSLGAIDAPSRSDVEKSIASLYYFAKNMAYSHENHYHELSQIQARLEFARSLAVIGFLYLVVVVAFVVFQLARLGYRKVFKRPGPQTSRDDFRKMSRRTALVAASFFCAYLFGLWAYSRETEAFNKRAFGYLSSHLIQERRAADQTAKLQAAKESAVAASRDNVAK